MFIAQDATLVELTFVILQGVVSNGAFSVPFIIILLHEILLAQIYTLLVIDEVWYTVLKQTSTVRCCGEH